MKRIYKTQPQQNGIRKPFKGTSSYEVWALADKLTAKLGSPTPIAPLLKKLVDCKHFNLNSVRNEYARWRKFHGISGRIV